MDKQGRIRTLTAQQARERERHNNKNQMLSNERMIAMRTTDPVKRSLKLQNVNVKFRDEASRHREKMAGISRRLRDARSR